MTMKSKQIWKEGFDNGYEIACNVYVDSDVCIGEEINPVWDWLGFNVLSEENWQDFFVDVALEVERSHFRQFSPFEIFAKELNDLKEIKPYDPWEIYEKGVLEGATKALKHFDPPYNDH